MSRNNLIAYPVPNPFLYILSLFGLYILVHFPMEAGAKVSNSEQNTGNPANEPINMVFILSDDHRYDFMGFHERAPSYIETPQMDRMAEEGMHLTNAFVTTSLCSPSRASILTGQYAHKHRVVDNERHKGYFSDIDIEYPASMDNTVRNYRTKPDWVKAQRYSWHGVDYPYQGDMNFDEFYLAYIETLLALDESVGRVLEYLKESGLSENTLVIYMGDNGFLHGEHGLIDKRHAYEESMRVPMIAWAPGFIEPGSTMDELVRNIDIAPTFLELSNTSSSIEMDGLSFLSLLAGHQEERGREFLYEYFWEPAFPHTPTTFAIRDDQYKYIWYHGVWDRDELYDLQNDPGERYNLSEVPQYRPLRNEMRNRLFDKMEARGAMMIPLRRADWQADEKLIGN